MVTAHRPLLSTQPSPEENTPPPALAAAGDDDQAIVERIRAGDEGAFTVLVNRFYAPLCHAVAPDVGPGAAPELVQELFWSIWQKRRTWVIHSSLMGYLFNAARHAALNARRRLRVHARWERNVLQAGDAPLMGAVQEASGAYTESFDLDAKLRHAIDSLPPRCRQMMLLRFVHDYTYPRIAEALGVTVKAVEGQMAKAMPVLRAVMGPALGR